MERLEQTDPTITFLNQPRMFEFEAQASFNKRRLSLVPFVEDYLLNHDKFTNKPVKVFFSQEGQSSLVCIVETPEEKVVFKVALNNTPSFGEALFLKTWEQVGVKVPRVFEEGFLDGQPYTLMEYIDVPTLNESYTHQEMIDKGLYAEMGRTLKLMHTAKGVGFGRVIDGRGEFDSFAGWLDSKDIKNKLNVVKENKLLEDFESIDRAFDLLKNFVGNQTESSCCHFDFAGNIFATSPITVFDPNPRFNHGYLDIGQTFVSYISRRRFPEGFVEAYFENEQCNTQALQASVLLNAVIKIPYQFKKGQHDVIKNIQEYLDES